MSEQQVDYPKYSVAKAIQQSAGHDILFGIHKNHPVENFEELGHELHRKGLWQAEFALFHLMARVKAYENLVGKL